MSELIEHHLNKCNGCHVTVVRPMYGNQSDSWYGILTTINTVYPLQFHFVSSGFAMIFTASDVVNVDFPTVKDSSPTPTIRLKGPLDYVNKTQTIH